MKPAAFVREVRQEMQKVTWITPKEVVSSTVVVLIMVVIASLFFLLADTVIYKMVQFVLGL